MRQYLILTCSTCHRDTVHEWTDYNKREYDLWRCLRCGTTHEEPDQRIIRHAPIGAIELFFNLEKNAEVYVNGDRVYAEDDESRLRAAILNDPAIFGYLTARGWGITEIKQLIGEH